MTKNQKRLIRIILSFVLLIFYFILNMILKIPWIVSLSAYLIIYIIIGYDIVFSALRNIVRGKVFDENFLMFIATLGAFVIQEFPEAVAVMLFYQIGELFQDYAVGKSRASIASLMNIKPDKAVVIKDEQEFTMAPEDVKIGDIIIVRAGEKIPVDGKIIKGQSFLDVKALTGESLPNECNVGDFILSGCINMTNVIYIQTEKLYIDSTVAKILDLVENASSKKTKAENFINRFAKYYTPSVVILATLLAFIPPIFVGQWGSWGIRGLTFLVVSCPCALVISVPMSFFGGIGSASKRGILIKGSNYFELMNRANIFVFDKTGTLTQGDFTIKEYFPNNSQNEILELAAICEYYSNHPIARCIIETRGSFDVDKEYVIEEVAGCGMIAKKDNDIILVGNARLMKNENIEFIENDGLGTVVYVAHNGEFVGSLLIGDTIKPSSIYTVQYLNKNNYKTIMLTGDREKTASIVAKEIGLTDYKAQLLPGDKVLELENIINQKNNKDVVVYIGDGINDAPVLARADIGISMGGVGSDSAIEASDIVFMHDNLEGIIEAKEISKKTLKIVRENIVFALAIKFIVLSLSAFGLANMWMAIFADVGVSVIAILNALRCLKYKKTNTKNIVNTKH